MDFFEAVERRASVRAFEPVEIAEDQLLRIVDAGRRAPSGRNRQPCQFVLITDKGVIERLSAVQACIGQASAATAVLVDDQLTEYWKEDAAAAIENMLLAIAALGYASVWVEGYVLRHEAMVKETLGVPDGSAGHRGAADRQAGGGAETGCEEAHGRAAAPEPVRRLRMLGIAFLEEPHSGVELTQRKRTHCAFMGQALAGEPVQIERATVSCPLARYYLGLDEGNIDGVIDFLMKTGDAEDEELARLYLSSGWRMTALGRYMLYFSHPLDGVEPTVLVKLTTPGRLAPIAHAYNRLTGRRLLASVSGMGAACGECTVYPILSGFPNLSLGCSGCKRNLPMGEDQMMLAAPRSSPMFDMLLRKG